MEDHLRSNLPANYCNALCREWNYDDIVVVVFVVAVIVVAVIVVAVTVVVAVAVFVVVGERSAVAVGEEAREDQVTMADCNCCQNSYLCGAVGCDEGADGVDNCCWQLRRMREMGKRTFSD